MTNNFTTKERKKEFDKIFKDKIIPYFGLYGFERHTKTSKRIFKNLGNGLSVFIFLEYKNQFKCYDISIVYFDKEIGDIYDDNYLAMVNGSLPSFSGDNKTELNLSVDDWLTELKSTVFPFIAQHSSYKSILDSNQFYISKGRLNEITELLKRKS